MTRLFSAVGLFVAAVLLLFGNRGTAQTLELRYSFEDSGTTAASDPSGALSVPLSLLNFVGAPTDLHGASGSGVQNSGHSLDLSAAFNAAGSVVDGPIAQVTNNAALGSLGVVSNFTMTVWFKQDTTITNTSSRAGRLVMLGTNGVLDTTTQTTNCIYLFYQNTNSIYARINNSTVSAPFYVNPLPSNVWMFAAVTYDGTNNACIYFGTETTPARLIAITSVGLQPVDMGSGAGGTGNLLLGNRPSDRTRAFDGWLDEFRFYKGDADAAFIENIRQASTPVAITGLYPDGLRLMEGTNTLAFVASSANGIDPSGIKVSVNGKDVSSSLVMGGTANSRTVSYTGLPQDSTLVVNSPINAVALNISVTDKGGITTSNIITYDCFSPANFTWEAEDYDYAADPIFGPGGLFIDNPRYAFEAAGDTYWQREGQPPVDYYDNATGAQADVYRGSFDLAATEFSVGTGANGGPSVGEMLREKVSDAIALNPAVRDVDVGYFDTGNWMNYTRTYPSGVFNVYTRAAFGGGTGNATLEQVTSGVGTPVQTTNTLGSFTLPNTGGWQSYAWIPLRDSSGNLVRLTLGGVETLRLSARSGGGGNNNFLMLAPANTNLPAISNIYPNGTNMFQPSPMFSFVASSPSGATISTNSIKVTLTITTVLRTITTNITTANGMIVTGTASSRNVSVPLMDNANYTAVIAVTDVNGAPAGTTVNFDTYNPSFVWEAEDYDFSSGYAIDNPTTDGYLGQMGTPEIDYHDNVTVSQNGTPVYRPADACGLENCGDTPLRQQFIGTGFQDYDVGWYDTGNWNNYTRTVPTGTYNIFLRAANGTTGNGGVTLSRVIAGQGTSAQTTTNLGSFTIPATGGWQTYTWIPLRDANGNLVKFIGTGAAQTIRATSGGGVNANFYAFFPANTNLPVISGVYPDGASMFQYTNKFTFKVTSSAGVTSNNITVTIDGVQMSNLVFSGSSTAWSISSPGLAVNQPHTATVSATDANGNSGQAQVSFDTFNASYYTWEAEDYDYGGGQFFDNPQVDAYTNLAATADVDFHDANTGGTYLYRPTGTATEITGDTPRPQFAGAYDYDIGYFGAGEWGNYTRHYPAGNYNVWGRFACGDANQSSALLSIVTSGWGTTTQSSNYLGSFSIPTTGWSSFGWVALKDLNGNLVSVTFNGSTNTVKLTRDPTSPYADCNVNCLMLVPAAAAPSSPTLSASLNGGNIVLSFPTQSGTTYQVEYKNELTDATWTPLGSSVSGDGTTKTVSDSVTNGHRFYHLKAQ